MKEKANKATEPKTEELLVKQMVDELKNHKILGRLIYSQQASWCVMCLSLILSAV